MYQPPQREIQRALDWLNSDDGRAVAELAGELGVEAELDVCRRIGVGRAALLQAFERYEGIRARTS